VSDPLRLVWDALARGGYGPHGKEYDFRARCPGHDGDNPTSLHVSAGSDGAALLWCFAQRCSPEDIVERLSLRIVDLFPVGWGNGRCLTRARREDFSEHALPAANVLLALDRLGLDWRVSIDVDECPSCEWPHAQIVYFASGHALVHCMRGCPPEAFTGALAEQIRHRRRIA
jgi:hypothetical protein